MEISHELKGLKSRLSRLQDVFNALPQNPPGPEEWPFWLEKFNALSGQFSGLEREFLNINNFLKEFILEPSNIPQNPTISLDSIPNILLRTKLAPEVIEKVQKGKKEESSVPIPSDLQLKLYSNTLRALQEKLSIYQEEFQRAAAEHSSSLLADEIKTVSGSATPTTTTTISSSHNLEDDSNAILENSIRWLYTGRQ